MTTKTPARLDAPNPMTMAARDDIQPLHGPYPGTVVIQPKSSLLGRIGMGLLCSTIVTVVMYFMQLKMFIIHVLAFIVALFGGGHYDVKTRTENGPGGAPAAAAFPGKTLLTNVLHTVEEKGKAAAKATTQPVKHVLQEAEKKVEHVEKTVVDAKDEALKKLAEMKEAREKAQAEADAAEKRRLLARAAELELNVSGDWTLAELRRAVAEAEQKRLLAQWRKRYNGSCPQCRQPMKVTLRGRGPVQCPRCGNISGQVSVRALAPPMPRNFRGF